MHEIEVWTLPDCPRCEEVKTALTEAGFRFVECPLQKLKTGEILNVDAMVQLVMQDNAAPLTRVDGRFVSDVEFEAMLLGTD